MPKGTIAVVNGEAISLHAAQALLDSRASSDLGAHRASLNEMRQNYAHAAAVLISHALIRQELASRDLQIDENAFELFLATIKQEYGEEEFSEALADASLREEDWRRFMRDSWEQDLFTKNILLPSIQISLDEIRQYYDQHRQEFSKPRLYRVCFGASSIKDDLQAWCDSGSADNFQKSSLARCTTVSSEEVPMPWHDELKKARLLECGKIVKEDQGWRTLVILEKQEAAEPSLASVYALIENILLADKKSVAFEEWLSKKLASSNILAAPDLFPHK